MLWITESPCAASAARSIAMPARMSGLSTDCPRKAEGPAMTARWGSHNTMRAPMPISLSTKKSRDSNSFSNTSNRPSHWVATTMAMDMRSAGNAGHGGQSDERADLDVIGADGMWSRGQRGTAFDRERVAADAVDGRAQGDEKPRQVLDVRLRRGIA